MKVPLSWLREFVEITLPLDELVHRLNMSGTEVEDVVDVGADWEQIFVAEVVRLERHPNADTLWVAQLDVGSQGRATIVTGATNLSVGARVPLVRPGGRLPGGRRVAAQDLRGIVSEGMLCSGDELGLSPDRSGIYRLDGEAGVGRPLGEALGETVLDLYITPNRPDCMSVFGVAREVHAITGAELRRIETGPPRGDRPAAELIRVEILDPDLCRRFTAACVTGVTVGPSPLWMQRRLHLAGVRPINNVVDATNYTMLELGQPQHAFDGDRLGSQIVVRRAAAGERIRTLDGVERELDGETLVIADAVNPVAIAGIMGGGPTEVSDATRNVVLETANFAPSSIRRTAAQLRLPSEASRRFERGLDPELAMRAAERTVALLVELAGGSAASGIVDVYPGRTEPRQILVDEDEIAALLGRPYSRAQVSEILESLDFVVEPQGERLLVTVPGHRVDVEGRADLAEEVARINGYDDIPDALPTGALPEPIVDPVRPAGERAKDVLVGCGLREVITYSLVAPGSASWLGAEDGIPVANPLSTEQSMLRTRLLPSLIETARANLRHRAGVAIFELARVYLPPLEPLPAEPLRLGIVMVGQAAPIAWNAPAREADFFDLKGVVEELLGAFGIEGRFVAAEGMGYHPGRCAAVRSGEGADGRSIGLLGQIHPRAAEHLDLRDRAVFAAELEFDVLAERARPQPQIAALPRFPGLDRDLALLLDGSTQQADVADALRTTGGPLLEEVRLFDAYEGPPIPPGKKSLAYTLRFRAADRTLTDAEADEVVARIVGSVKERFGAEVRGSGTDQG
jgi:phenylalanyl-tRNA synthetase beta chain